MLREQLVSVIVPIYKVEEYLDDCVQSLLKQTYANIEILLVDDGSPDSCGKMIDMYASQDNRIIPIHKSNGGLSSARNEGLRYSKGDYVAFVDSDDVVDQLYIEKLLECIKNSMSEIAVCRFDMFREEVPTSSSYVDDMCIYNRETALLEMFKNDSIGWGAWNKLYKMDLFREVRYPVGMICEDKATTYKLILQSGKIAFTQNVLYHYRIRESSISGQHSEQYSLDSVRINNMIEEDLSGIHSSILANEARAYSAKCAFMLYANAYQRKSFPKVLEVCRKELQDKYPSIIKAHFLSFPYKVIIYIAGVSSKYQCILLNLLSKVLYIVTDKRKVHQ